MNARMNDRKWTPAATTPRTDRFVELVVELPFVNVESQRFPAEKLEQAQELARNIRAYYPAAKIKLHWVKVTIVASGSMKDVEVDVFPGSDLDGKFVSVPKDKVGAPLRGRDVWAQEHNAVSLDRPARGAWGR
jgi:hypothetical protein